MAEQTKYGQWAADLPDGEFTAWYAFYIMLFTNPDERTFELMEVPADDARQAYSALKSEAMNRNYSDRVVEMEVDKWFDWYDQNYADLEKAADNRAGEGQSKSFFDKHGKHIFVPVVAIASAAVIGGLTDAVTSKSAHNRVLTIMGYLVGIGVGLWAGNMLWEGHFKKFKLQA